jgi:Na+-transporting methylmalonyl-CoA/oxaloacetate decarboxylase gamma subunit
MKSKILVLCVIALATSLCPAENHLQNLSVSDISELKAIPVRKIIEYLDLPQNTDISIPIIELDRSNEDMENAIAKYNANKPTYYLGVVVAGMGTVFFSLLIVAFIIDQLQLLDKKKKVKPRKIPIIQNDALESDGEEDVVSAIVTALYLYELEIEENNKLLLTWKRTPLSMWKAARFVSMNEIDPSRRK